MSCCNKKYKGGIEVTHPWLLYEWLYRWNVENPFKITAGSCKKIYWQCYICQHCWKATVSNRALLNRGCPACANKVVTEFNNLKFIRPNLSKEWDKNLNGELKAGDVIVGTNRKVWWCCATCGYQWKAGVCYRTKAGGGSGCPSCTNHIATHLNNLTVKFKEISEEWSPNNKKEASEFVPGSDAKVLWRCKDCFKEWKAKIYHRTGKSNSGCPYCTNQKVEKENSVKTTHPEILDKWDFDKNRISPEEVSYGSGKKVWLFCDVCEHSWKSTIYHTIGNERGCPKCAKGQMSKVSQVWLDALNISIREFYIKDLNIRADGFDPETNTVYEFLGDFWHGNPETHPAGKINKLNKKSFGQLYQDTLKRFKLLKENGYKVKYVWENDYNKGIMFSEDIK